MKTKDARKPFDHSGSSFDQFLEEEGIREEVEAVAIQRVLAWQLRKRCRGSGRPGALGKSLVIRVSDRKKASAGGMRAGKRVA